MAKSKNQGRQGVRGIPGPAGPRGDAGVSGAAGKIGNTGKIGKIGKIGKTGKTGRIGKTGLHGIRGARGKAGATEKLSAAGRREVAKLVQAQIGEVSKELAAHVKRLALLTGEFESLRANIARLLGATT